MVRRLLLTVSAALITYGSVASAQAHRTPHACTVTPPTTLLAVHETSSIAAMASERPATLYVLYHDRSAGPRTVSLLALSGIDTARPEPLLFAAGEGSVAGPALTLQRDRALAAFVSPAGHVQMFVHPFVGGGDHTMPVDHAGRADAVALGTLRNRSFVVWSDGAAVHGATVAPDGSMRGRVWSWSGHATRPVAGSGGLLLASGDTAGILGAPSGTGASAVEGAEGSPASMAIVGHTPLVAWVHDGRAEVSALHGHRSSTTSALGSVDTAPGSLAIGATQWGALAAWSDHGLIQVQPLDDAGHASGSPMPVMDPSRPERARAIAVTGRGDDGIVVYSADHVNGSTASPAHAALRMVRIRCQ